MTDAGLFSFSIFLGGILSVDPFILCADPSFECTDERWAINHWLDKHQTSPVSRESMSRDRIYLNRNLKKSISRWCSANNVKEVRLGTFLSNSLCFIQGQHVNLDGSKEIISPLSAWCFSMLCPQRVHSYSRCGSKQALSASLGFIQGWWLWSYECTRSLAL